MLHFLCHISARPEKRAWEIEMDSIEFCLPGHGNSVFRGGMWLPLIVCSRFFCVRLYSKAAPRPIEFEIWFDIPVVGVGEQESRAY